MDEQGYTLSREAVRKVAETVRRVSELGSSLGGVYGGAGAPSGTNWYRIVSNGGDGSYTARLQVWDVATAALVDVADTNDREYGWDRPAWDVRGNSSAKVNDRVAGWAVWVNGSWLLLLDVSGGLGAIRLGHPSAAWTSGATITLDPCDSAGTDNGLANFTVQAGWTLPTVTGTALNIPTTAIVPCQLAADGNYYVLGQPVQAWGQVTYNTDTHKLLQTTWYDWGWFRTTISDPQEVTTAVDCTAV